jgi:(p)ppGpp synthase/HD superfamily hydrolase
MYMNPMVTQLTRALTFAAAAHVNQRRKGAAQEPYIDHLIQVLDLVACATGGDDIGLCVAALLHDIIEDTDVTPAVIEDAFGPRILRIVEENSDDMTLPKEERRLRRISAMARKSPEAHIIKIADVISNLRALIASPPAGWSAERKLGYPTGCRQLVDAGRGVNSDIEALFDLTAADAERSIREEAAFDMESHADDTA